MKWFGEVIGSIDDVDAFIPWPTPATTGPVPRAAPKIDFRSSNNDKWFLVVDTAAHMAAAGCLPQIVDVTLVGIKQMQWLAARMANFMADNASARSAETEYSNLKFEATFLRSRRHGLSFSHN